MRWLTPNRTWCGERRTTTVRRAFITRRAGRLYPRRRSRELALLRSSEVECGRTAAIRSEADDRWKKLGEWRAHEPHQDRMATILWTWEAKDWSPRPILLPKEKRIRAPVPAPTDGRNRLALNKGMVQMECRQAMGEVVRCHFLPLESLAPDDAANHTGRSHRSSPWQPRG
jgi:hypothetical protein